VVARNNAVIVYDTEARLAQMEKALEELDIETLQIMITAKLVVVDSRLTRELGVDWTARTGSPLPNVQGGNPSINNPSANATRMTAMVANNADGTQIAMNVLDQNMSVAINSLLTDSRSEVLASPQISTLDHTRATIFMGEKVMVRTIDDNGQSTNQMVETGIKLMVTPHVTGDNRILLELKPENNSFYFEGTQLVINTQEAETKVVVADGETVVIGGLTKNEEKDTEVGIPFLKDIPLLGYLFKYSKRETIKNDLIIFVTPRIMYNYLGSSEEMGLSQTPKREEPAPTRRRAEVEEDDWE
jgi:type II secretory pathway component GspD/PulD (secretin)